MSHIIVIGGTKGLGRAFVETAWGNYTHVSILARTIPKSVSGDRVRYIATDVTQSASLKSGLGRAIAESGKITHLVFFQQHRGSENRWSGKLASTLTATRDALDFCADHFAAEGDKAVVMLTSIASQMVAEEQDEGYHAAKTGLLGLARYYACKLGSLGVRVNCISPGTVLKAASKHHFLENPELHAWFKQVVPLNRMGTEREVASVIQFLLSEAASFITGQELVVDGGAGLRSQESLARALFNHRTEIAKSASALNPALSSS